MLLSYLCGFLGVTVVGLAIYSRYSAWDLKDFNFFDANDREDII